MTHLQFPKPQKKVKVNSWKSGQGKRRKTMKPLKKEKLNLKKLRKEVIDLAKFVAKTRDGWICQKSGQKVAGSNAHGSHIIPVSHGNALKYDPENIICLSYHNHINWWHKNPLEAAEWFKQKFPERLKYLEERKGITVKYTEEDLLKMKNDLKKQLYELTQR